MYGGRQNQLLHCVKRTRLAGSVSCGGPKTLELIMPRIAKIRPQKSELKPNQNRILAALNALEYERLVPDLEFVLMPLGWTMSESGDHVNYLHFPTSGIVSLIYDLEDGSSSEVALVGNEGMVGVSIFMGGESMPSSTTVQSAGGAF